MNAMGFILASGLLSLTLTGCINQRSPQDIKISSTPSGATVVIRDSAPLWEFHFLFAVYGNFGFNFGVLYEITHRRE